MSETELKYHIDPQEINRQLDRIRPSKYPLIACEDSQMPASPFIQAYAPEANLEIFSQATEFSGFFNMLTDPDGGVRWMPLIIQCGEDIYPPIAVQCAWHYLDRPQLCVKVAGYGVEEIQMGKTAIPTDENGLLLINHLGPPKTFPRFSITDILGGRVPKETFKDKIVLIGSVALGAHDLRNTPFDPLFPGVEIHAAVIDNILSGRFLKKPEWTVIFDLFSLVLLGVLVGVAIPRLSAVKGALFFAGLFAFYILTARQLFVSYGVWLNMVYPLLVFSTTYIALTVYEYLSEERERKRIKGAFGQYVSKSVIDLMLKNPERLKLGGEEKTLSVLFIDLVSFTGYSEQLTPAGMITILSDYFKEMTDQVFAYQGTLKEYVGDELMAIFGAPIDLSDHADRACAAALAMQDRLRHLRRIWSDLDRPALRARVGVNSGPMLVGNLGSTYRFSYGALGDHVNLGSRLQGLNKLYGTEILIGDNTAHLLKDAFLLREVDAVRVQGRQQPVSIYELVAAAGKTLPKERKDAFARYAAGLKAYRQQHWEEALEHFEHARALWPEDKASRVMADRCLVYQKEPPTMGWDGVFRERRKT